MKSHELARALLALPDLELEIQDLVLPKVINVPIDPNWECPEDVDSDDKAAWENAYNAWFDSAPKKQVISWLED